jgi:hypothetical protein
LSELCNLFELEKFMNQKLIVCGAIGLASLMSGCSFLQKADMMDSPTSTVPAAIMVPAGHKMVMKTNAIGELTYECRTKANLTNEFEWAFVSPTAVLYDMNKAVVGKYYAGPTWEMNDGSKITGKQIAIAPGASGAIPLQIVKAGNPTGMGFLNDVTHIQRLNTEGGVAPTASCTSVDVGTKKTVPYKADYVFFKAN